MIRVLDLLGREQTILDYGNKSAGLNRLIWDGKNRYGESLPSGIWLIQFQFGNNNLTKKVLLLK
jgi:flagellar hook assembly protein FlgD